MVGCRLHEHRSALLHGNLLALDLENAGALEDNVELVVLVGLLPVGLWRDEHIDPDFEAGRLVWTIS